MLLQKLRVYCQDDHETLHDHPLLAPLQGEIKISEYKDILAMFYAAYLNTELAKMTVNLPDCPILDWLENDMKTHHIMRTNWTAESMSLNSKSKMVGYLYVKQGSCLGGQYISKLLAKKLGLEAGKNNLFFHGYGSETGLMWRSFKEKLEHIEHELNHDEVLSTAKHSFLNIKISADRMMRKPA